MTPLYNIGRNRPGNSSIALLIVLAIGMVVAIFVGLTIGQGDLKKVYIIALLLGAFPVLLMLGDKYWVLLPFAMTVTIPAVPLVPGRSVSFGELWVVASIGAYILRFPFMGNRVRLFKADYIPVLLYAGWAGLIYKANGAGLAIFGAATVGGRSYLTILLALAAFFLISNQTVGEKQAKWITYTLLLSGVVSTVWLILQHFIAPANTVDDVQEGFYTWHQNLTRMPYYALAYIFARYSPSDLLARLHVGLMGFISVCYGMIIFSGKRGALAGAILYPIISSVFRRQYGIVLVFLSVCALSVTVLVFGHGRVFQLPQTVQRVLWIFPGDWDYIVRNDTAGTFRKTLNRLAIEEIGKNPIIGRGFGFTSLDAWLATDPNAIKKIQQKGDHYGAFIMAAAGEWHNTWLGISACFGIPAAVLWGFVWLHALFIGRKVVARAPPGSHLRTLALMLVMLLIVAIVNSATGGHAARSFWNNSWMVALLISMKWQITGRVAAPAAQARAKAPAAALEPVRANRSLRGPV